MVTENVVSISLGGFAVLIGLLFTLIGFGLGVVTMIVFSED